MTDVRLQTCSRPAQKFRTVANRSAGHQNEFGASREEPQRRTAAAIPIIRYSEAVADGLQSTLVVKEPSLVGLSLLCSLFQSAALQI